MCFDSNLESEPVRQYIEHSKEKYKELRIFLHKWKLECENHMDWTSTLVLLYLAAHSQTELGRSRTLTG